MQKVLPPLNWLGARIRTSPSPSSVTPTWHSKRSELADSRPSVDLDRFQLVFRHHTPELWLEQAGSWHFGPIPTKIRNAATCIPPCWTMHCDASLRYVTSPLKRVPPFTQHLPPSPAAMPPCTGTRGKETRASTYAPSRRMVGSRHPLVSFLPRKKRSTSPVSLCYPEEICFRCGVRNRANELPSWCDG